MTRRRLVRALVGAAVVVASVAGGALATAVWADLLPAPAAQEEPQRPLDDWPQRPDYALPYYTPPASEGALGPEAASQDVPAAAGSVPGPTAPAPSAPTPAVPGRSVPAGGVAVRSA